MKRYLFLDIDGTLYSTKIDDVPKSAKKAIQIARKNGSKVFLCTGRSLAECQKYLVYDVDGFVFAAGSLIYAEKKRIYDHPFSKAQTKKIKKICHDLKMGYCCEGMAGAYSDERGWDFILNYFSSSKMSKEYKMRNAMSNGIYPEEYAHEDDPIYKVCVYDRDEKNYKKLRKALPEIFALTMTVRDSKQGHCGEITNAKITKSTGIGHILEKYHAGYEDAVAIGDSANDIPMIEDCGIGIAMGNAFPEVKKIADFVTTDILDDGIYRAFEKVGVLQK